MDERPGVGWFHGALESNCENCTNSSRFSERSKDYVRSDCRDSCAGDRADGFAKLRLRQIDLPRVRGKSVTTDVCLPSLRQEDVIVKMRSLLLAAAAGLCVAGLSFAQENRLPASAATNQELANAVAAQLQKCGLRGYTIDISCKDGEVELRGRVADKVQHDLVVRSVLMIPGVKSVADGLMA